MTTSPEQPGSVEPRPRRVAAAVQGWQRHLVDLGGRNTLLWYRDLPAGTLELTTAHPGGVAMLLAGRPTRLSDLVREPTAFRGARHRARVIRAQAIELHEERGLVAGFIAVGMATWRVPGAPRPPVAPVLLRRCTLRPTGAAQQDFDVDLGAEVELNPVLQQYLRSEQRIELDAEALARLATAASGFDPHPVYVELARACARVPGFRITPRLVVSTFSHGKLAMVADLAAQAETLADHDILAALAGDPDALRAVRSTVAVPPVDADPSQEHLVLDADSAQQAVVEAVRAGANLVVKGPPGTGKSQTIANLVAGLAGDGKRVLLVAEKRAAIDAVVGRLDRVGLGDLVLDAPDGATDRRRLTAELDAALDRSAEVAKPDTTGTAESRQALVSARAELVQHRASMHDPRAPWGISAADAQVALSRLATRPRPPSSRVRVGGEALRGITRERLDRLSSDLAEAASLGAWTSGAGQDPWYGSRFTSPEEAARALDVTTRLSCGELTTARQQAAALMEEAGLPEPMSVADWQRSLALMEQARDTLEVFRPEVFDAPLDDVVLATAASSERRAAERRLGRLDRSRLRRQVRHLLRPGPPPADTHGLLERAEDQLRRWQQLAGSGSRPVAPAGLEEAARTLAPIAQDLRWLGERLAGTSGGDDLAGAQLDRLQERLVTLASCSDRLFVVPRVVTLLDGLRTAGLGALVDDLARRGVAAQEVPVEAEFVWWASLISEIAAHDPRYGAHDGDHLRAVVTDYVEADHQQLRAAAEGVRVAVARRLREVLTEHPEQEALVRAESTRWRPPRALRDLLPGAADVLTAIRPCWAMSPLVVAALLPPGRWFDVVVFDEASQIPTAEAVSALSRAAQVVVVGDERQLPPARFSVAAADDADDDTWQGDEHPPTDGFESVLDALAAALPVHRLTWHYRSRDERLIAFANHHLYDGALVTFPGTAAEPVLELDVVPPEADPPSTTTAPASAREEPGAPGAEVARVVERILQHARTRPQESLGVIALGVRHARRIEEALRVALVGARDVAAFFREDVPERFFIKDVERVQGDERDAIIVSIGRRSREVDGRVLPQLGPLTDTGGERRLNVAVTRARRRMTVVSSFGPDDLPTSALGSAGARLLQDFLRYAASGGSPAPAPVAGAAAPAPSAHPLVAELARRLRSQGLVVHEDVGSSSHRLDLAVDDPRHGGRPLVAVETDGPVYASMAGTRERDRLRTEQLERLGWQHVRVWTTDVFRDPARDVARVVAAVRAVSARAGR